MIYRSAYLVFLSACLALVGSAQAPPPPPPIAKPKTVEAVTKTDEQLAAEIAEVVKKPAAWARRPLPGFSIDVEMPRETVRQTETFFEAGLGNMQVVMHLSLSDSAAFVVGQYRLPYSVSDEKVLRDLYRSLVSGMSDEGVQYQHVKDFIFEGKLGVEMRSLPEDVRYQSARGRAFVYGRDVYIMLALPAEDENEHEPPEKAVADARTGEFDRFFGSAAVVATVARSVIKESPMFASSWKEGKFTSEFFRFTYEPPKGWIILTQTDVDDIRSWGRKVLKDDSGRDLPASGPRRNLATFLSAPLGSDSNAMIAFTLGIPANSFTDVRKLAIETDRLLGGIPSFKIVKKPFKTTVGNTQAMGLRTTVTAASVEQEQHIFYFLQAGYVHGLTVTCVNSKDCADALTSFSSLTLSSK